MSRFKKVKVGVATLLLGLSLATPALAKDLSVKVDGQNIKLDVPPVVKESRTLVPIAPIAEQLGADVTFDSGSQTVGIKTVDKNIKISIGSKHVQVNNESQTLDVPAEIIDGRTMVPLRFVGEALGAKVNYDSSDKTVNINYFTDMDGTLKVGGSTTIQPLTQTAADKLMSLNKGLSISIAGGGSGEGIKGANAGTFNIGSVSRDLEAADKKDYPDLKSYDIGSDGIVVIINPKNKVDDLSKQQVIDIFTGKIKNWKEVGGADEAIFIQTRESGSGTLTAFEELALKKKAKVATTATPHNSNGLIKEAVSKNTNAIGFLSMGYVDKSVKATKIEGVSPLKSKALSREWPYVRGLNVVTKGYPAGLTAKFINYLRSTEGQAIVAQDYLPLKAQD